MDLRGEGGEEERDDDVSEVATVRDLIRGRLPVAILKTLPAAITRADPETLSFLSTDRYPTGSAIGLAERHGLSHPDVATALIRWSDYLAANGFGEHCPRSASLGRRPLD